MPLVVANGYHELAMARILQSVAMYRLHCKVFLSLCSAACCGDNRVLDCIFVALLESHSCRNQFCQELAIVMQMLSLECVRIVNVYELVAAMVNPISEMPTILHVDRHSHHFEIDFDGY